MTTEISPAIIEALSVGLLPDVQWKAHDDLCDCVYQRIGMWTNPYLAETLEVRMCCIWAKFYEQYPEFSRTVPAFWDYNADEWVTEPMDWNGEEDMPAALWHRQLARRRGISVTAARHLNLAPPKGTGVKPKPIFFLPWGGEYVPLELGA